MRASARVGSFVALAVVLTCPAAFPQQTAFSVNAHLWPSSNLPIGTFQDIIFAGDIRNDSAQNATWLPYAQMSRGYGQVRVAGLQSPPLCETARQDKRNGDWSSILAIGTRVSFSYSFENLSCQSPPTVGAKYEARFCVNPHVLQPWSSEVCSSWAPFTLDAAGAAIRHDDTLLRARFNLLASSINLSLQQTTLAALDVRAYTTLPSNEEVSQIKVGTPNKPLATLWLEFFIAQDIAIRSLKASLKTVYTHVEPPLGCYPTPDNLPCARTHPDLAVQYEKDVAENDRNAEAALRFAELRTVSRGSYDDFFLYMSSRYRGNATARDELYAQARSMGLADEQVSELRRLVEFGTGGRN